jgi:hypothetical protein
MNKLIALVGAGGKMGRRISPNLVKYGYNFVSCARDEAGIAALKAKGFEAMTSDEAVKIADIIVLALPDAALPELTRRLVPLMKPGTTVLTLDPAAAQAGQLTTREDCTFVVVHPCHPPLFAEVDTPEEMADHFGGAIAAQDLVIALLQGNEEAFTEVRQICLHMFSPVTECHRITVEQMAILEPAAAEVVSAMCATIMKAAIDEAILRGVPKAAAWSFMLGHINLALAVVLKSNIPFSDACKIAVEYGYRHVLRDDWKKVFEPESIQEVLTEMLHLNK